MEVIVNEYTSAAGPLEWFSYILSWLTLFFSAAYAMAFRRHMRHPDPMVQALSCAVTASCLLLFFHTLLWDVGLRTEQLLLTGTFTSRSLELWFTYPWIKFNPMKLSFHWFSVHITRIQYMIAHFMGFVFVAYRLGQFLRMTIPLDEQARWPWWKAAFYPNTRYLW